MQTLVSFKNIGYLKADQLVELVQSLIGRKGSQEFTKRTLRYYATKGIIPRPIGPPKFARYNYNHLLAILAIRMFQDKGVKLREIYKELIPIHRGRTQRLETSIQKWLNSIIPTASYAYVSESATDYQSDGNVLNHGQLMRQISLTSNCTLFLRQGDTEATELLKAHLQLEKLLETLKVSEKPIKPRKSKLAKSR